MYTPLIEGENLWAWFWLEKSIKMHSKLGNYNNPNKDLALGYKIKPTAEKNLLGGNLHVMWFPQEKK